MKRLKRSRKSSYNNDGKSIDNPPKEDELPSTSNTDEDMPVDNQTKDAPNVEPWKKGIFVVVFIILSYTLYLNYS